MPRPKITLDISLSQLPSNTQLLSEGGGAWRVPAKWQYVQNRVLGLPRGGGVVRAAMEDVLDPATSLADVNARLDAYGWNAYVQAAAARGDTIMVCLDAAPAYLRSDPNDHRAPPNNLTAWNAVVAAVVAHFQSLGVNPVIEVWNEPDGAGFSGTYQQYFAVYAASVIPGVKLGGPAVSSYESEDANGFFVDQFIAYCRANSLPLDFFTFHAFGHNPSSFHNFIVPWLRGKLDAAGYAAAEIINGEWNVFAAPPYPEPGLCGTLYTAAYAATHLFDAPGLARQAFQMKFDPGSNLDYKSGAFSTFGVERPLWLAFAFMHQLAGQRYAVTSSDPWVSGVAYIPPDGGKQRVVLAVHVPAVSVIKRDLALRWPIENHAEYIEAKAIGGAAIDAYLEGGAMPPCSPALAALLVEAKATYDAYKMKKTTWAGGIDIDVRWAAGYAVGSASVWPLTVANTPTEAQYAQWHNQLMFTPAGLYQAKLDQINNGIESNVGTPLTGPIANRTLPLVGLASPAVVHIEAQ